MDKWLIIFLIGCIIWFSIIGFVIYNLYIIMQLEATKSLSSYKTAIDNHTKITEDLINEFNNNIQEKTK